MNAAVAALASTALLLGACGNDESAAPSTTAAAAADGQLHWEAVALAESAEVVSDSDGTVLRLDGVDPEVTAFTDRPDRLAGPLAVHDLLALWSSGVFRDDPPNAALVLDDTVLAVELQGAVYDSTTDTLWFGMDPLPDPAGAAPDLSQIVNRPYGPAQLFIDGFPSPVDNQVVQSIGQTNVKVLGESPALGEGLAYQTMAHSVNLGPLEARSSVDTLTNGELSQSIADLKSSSAN